VLLVGTLSLLALLVATVIFVLGVETLAAISRSRCNCCHCCKPRLWGFWMRRIDSGSNSSVKRKTVEECEGEEGRKGEAGFKSAPSVKASTAGSRFQCQGRGRQKSMLGTRQFCEIEFVCRNLAM